MIRLFVIAFMLWAVAADASQVATLAATETGVNGDVLADADGLSVPATTDILNMTGNGSKFKNQLSLELHFTWGTSTSAIATCEEDLNGDGVFGTIQRCTDASPHVCADRQWQYDKPAGATSDAILNVPNTGHSIRCQVWDAAEGTGTIIITGARTEQ